MMLGDLPILPLPAPPIDGNLGPLPLSQLPETSGQDNQENDNNNSQQNSSTDPAPVATHTRTIGIIHPPPDIRTIVDKTAQFVAKNGNEFERRIIGNNAGNAKFNFLNGSDPYHAYYQHRLSEFRAQAQHPQPGAAATAQPATDSAPTTGDVTQVAPEGEMVARVDPSAMFRPVKKVIEPPEREIYTVRLPEGITGEELDIIRLTAQFTARNGKSFLTGLTSREINNPQFHFLKPTHSMFTFFTRLADVYSLVLMPTKGLTEKLSKSVVDMTTVLERCFNRFEWDRSEAQARQKMEDEVEQEKIEWQSIDWHDFVVVETIEFVDDEDDELPPPMTLEEVIRRSKVTSAMEEDEVVVEPGKEADMEMDEEEVQLVEEGMKAASLDENDVDKKNNESKLSGPPDEPEAPIRIVKNWKRPEERLAAEKDPTKFVVSPITGELIPISEMAEHMRISLIDPKYKEQKERMMAKIRETTLAQDDEISRNIVGLARTRPDIFGTTEEEVSNAVKAEIEKKKEEQPKQVIWDGHTGSIGRTANQAMSQNLNGEDQNDSSLPGPAAPPPRPGLPSIRSLPPPPGLALNMPRMLPNGMQYSVPTSGGMQYTTPASSGMQYTTPASSGMQYTTPTSGGMQYSAPTSSGMLMPPPPRPPMISINPTLRPPLPPMPMTPQQPQMMNRPPPPPQISVNPPVPPPPGSQFTPLPGTRPFAPLPMSAPPMPMIPPPPLPQGMPPPPPEEAPPPLPEEPEPKRAKTDDCIPEEMFLAQHPGPARIVVSVPNVDEGNLKGQLLEITVQSLSETVGNLKEKIAGEVQLPANKQKLSGRVGFLKDTLSLAACNIAPGETLVLSLRERGGRKR